ncbi:hypothetical protein VKT23_009234 [Stygiomarasmius scandens]|uniref:Protein kinase domain-containing protein n=1 Tax=Marasmiellus scandens TaxID=2682957 RepID=A0ABR1JKU1_9AGAR
MTFSVPHYVPSFFWRFWLSNNNQLQTRQPRLHVYDVYNGDLLELKTPAVDQRSVFQDLDSALDNGPRKVLRFANRVFKTLESQAETAFSKLIEQTRHEESSPLPTSVFIESREISTVIKFLVFLRFRNSPKYQEMIKELLDPSDVSLSIRHHGTGDTILSVYSPLYRQVRITAVLTIFTRFFETPLEKLSLSLFDNKNIGLSRKDPCLKIIDNYFWRYCREVEICLGIPSGTDEEYILSDSCYGILDASFGSGASVGTGTGPEQNPETESYDYFFPILPKLAVYVICTEEIQTYEGLVAVDVGLEMAIDIFLRNAMVLSNVPYNRRPTHTFVPYNRIPANDREEFMNSVSMLKMSSASTSTSVSLPIPEEAASMLDSLEPSIEAMTDECATLSLDTSGPKLYFHSLSSIAKSISSYDEFRCRWIADKFIDYSRLKQRCRQKFCMEQVMKMLPIKQDMVVIDLSEEVKLVGREPVAYGAFSDVWKGQWFDRVERKERGVAVKYLRQVMVRKVNRERLVKRLQAEIVTWHQLCHRNLATLFGIIQDHNGVGMVSLWCENGTIGEFLKKKPDRNKLRLASFIPCSLNHTFSLVRSQLVQIASGVAYLHHFNPPVVHGDLKGTNILIDDHEQAVITDFGLSKVMEDVTSSMPGEDGKENKVLSTSFFAGSTRWMAPELIQALVEDEGGKIPQVTTHSDVYAFASVCLEIATGQLPYPHRTNDHAVTVDILRGIGPARGAIFSSQQLGITVQPSSPVSPMSDATTPTSSPRFSLMALPSSTSHPNSCPCTPTSSSPAVDEDDIVVCAPGKDQVEHDCFRVILERCWSPTPFLRPNMEDVLNCFVAMEARY